MTTALLLLLTLPLLGFAQALLLGKDRSKWASSLSTLLMAAGFGLSLYLALPFLTEHAAPWVVRTAWFTFPGLSLHAGFYLDAIGAVLLLIVTTVSLLVHLFSLVYMGHDPAKHRYFAYLGLFTAAMLGLVVSENLLQLFMCWELVGLASFLLIGFWYQKPAAAQAAKKAFLVNRIGDVCFLAGLAVLYAQAQSWSLPDIAPLQEAWLPGLLLFLGALGKSAQFPLQVWLPDAMQGPTPVSALIHAATMVAAGVYLLVRVAPLLEPILPVIALVGATTALLGALSATVQQDIKKVLAYSTISQLGYMVLGVGSGVAEAAFFHLTTHAFFKAGLFLSAGAVIHYLHEQQHAGRLSEELDAQDFGTMGGLHRHLPAVSIAFILCGAALAGLPLFCGFLSKEAILAGAFAQANALPAWMGLMAAALTPFYIARAWKLAFAGTNQAGLQAGGPKLAKSMSAIVLLLGLLSLAVWFGPNVLHADHSWLMHLFGGEIPHALSWLAWVSVALAIGGIALALLRKRPGRAKVEAGLLERIAFQHFYLDAAYSATVVPLNVVLGKMMHWVDGHVIDPILHVLSRGQVVVAQVVGWVDKQGVDGLVNGLARLASRVGATMRTPASGQVQTYLIRALVATAVGVLWLIFW